MTYFRPPTSFLPPLSALSTHTTGSMQDALQDLKDLYFPAAARHPKMTRPTNAVPALRQDISNTVHVPHPKRTGRLNHSDGVPDSGYASEEDEAEMEGDPESEAEGLDTDALRSDELERNFAIIWLTGLIKRSDLWMHVLDGAAEQEELTRLSVIEQASKLLACFAGDDEQQEDALTATIYFSFCIPQRTAPLRVLELGAGTGLLSIATARLLESHGDYHSAVLDNLLQNVKINNVSVQIESLDWSRPPPLEPYDVILGADVVYHPEHAKWIKNCVEKMLKKGGVFWLIIAMRSSGRHDGLWETVDNVFPDGGYGCLRNEGCGGELKLAVLHKEDVGRREGIGRADEVGYRLFEIRWLPCRSCL
ncbi:hypothetical protein EDD22DRAFT_885790 [Suillus occidentalis]|nr:hypothetical protein EDD22DRAFT_885790 [Suillus occidentalis]